MKAKSGKRTAVSDAEFLGTFIEDVEDGQVVLPDSWVQMVGDRAVYLAAVRSGGPAVVMVIKASVLRRFLPSPHGKTACRRLKLGVLELPKDLLIEAGIKRKVLLRGCRRSVYIYDPEVFQREEGLGLPWETP